MVKTVSVIGLGFIGLPLSMALCERGFRVIGVDVDEQKISQLWRGKTQLEEEFHGVPLQDLLQKHIDTGSYVPTSRYALAAWEADVYIVTVGAPVCSDGKVNTTPLEECMESLGRVLKPNDTVILRSTLVPGLVEHLCIPMLERTSRLQAGTDFHVSYAAERVAEGRAMVEFHTLDIVLGGLTNACADRAIAVLSQLTTGHIHVTDIRTAQMTKVIENVQRDVNIALAHEIRRVCEAHGIDVFELIQLANTHPRVHLLQPGVGVGGYCIPNAYHYLRESIELEQDLPLLKLARDMNASIPRSVVDEVCLRMLRRGKTLEGSTIAVIGLGMKDNSNDTRLSPSISVVHEFMKQGAVVRAYDPLLPIQFPYQTSSLKDCLFGADAVVVAAWHDVLAKEEWALALSRCQSSYVVFDLKHRLESYIQPSPAPMFQAEAL